VSFLRTLPFVAAAALFLGGCSRGQDSGVELGYRFLGTTKPGQVTELKQVVRRRIEGSGVASLEIRDNADGILVRLPGATGETVLLVKRLLRSSGKLEFRPAAPLDVQKKFAQDGAVPPGYTVFDNPTPARGGQYEAFGAKVLLGNSVIGSRDIAAAEPRQEMVPGGHRWVTAFELNADGARRFDEVATELYNRTPAGLLAIMVNGEIRSMPAMQSPSFKGRGQVSGAKNQADALELAVILRSGELPVPLGSRKDGKDVLGEPESERPYGSKK